MKSGAQMVILMLISQFDGQKTAKQIAQQISWDIPLIKIGKINRVSSVTQRSIG